MNNISAEQAGAPYVAPYTAIGISTVVYTVSERRQIRVNLQTIEDAIHAAMGVVSINLPVKVIALPEGALTGFPDEIYNIPHITAARDIFIDIPGEEAEFLGRLARHYETYIIFQCKARWPEIIADRYFNTLAVINPEGQVVHKAAKNHVWCREHSTVPHDVYSRWIEVFGDGIEAFYPVLRTPDIGVIGTICCSDGEYPEAVRALAFNGAEVVYRPSEAIPMTGNGYPGGGTWLIQNQGHAQFNSVYMLCPNVGPVYAHPRMKHAMDIGGGNSHIVDYTGQVIAYSPSGDNSFVAAPIYIDALRQYRTMNLNTNWLKDMRMELFRRMYERSIHPKDLALEQPPGSHAEVDEIYRQNIERLIASGTYTPPAHRVPGPKYFPAAPTPQEEWESVRALWDGWPPDD
ncbi:MAG TPA: nitrilase-related carbon-nitrogen hydrolase [Ktedonobacteraceae bacterium]|nr:nitrilase-related carbon-nitrogen hydrolase [Ktedonobacteraceae bacterium]